jgi:hypothetical protein
MIIDNNLLLEKLDSLETLLTDFKVFTGELSAVDLETVEETDSILAKRGRIIAEMNVITPEIAEIIAKQTPEQEEMLKNMLNGETIIKSFTEEENAIQTRIISIRSLQSEIMKSEDSNRMKFKRKYDEVRDELEKLKEEKKRIDYYQSAKVGGPEAVSKDFKV